eukprot:COSAG04_NODE_4764_length_1904_cov_1.449307_1_plen_124_part_00
MFCKLAVALLGLAATADAANASRRQLQEDCADINDSGEVDVADLLLLLASYGSANADADIDGSGEVDVADLLSLLAGYGSQCTRSGACSVPPPPPLPLVAARKKYLKRARTVHGLQVQPGPGG